MSCGQIALVEEGFTIKKYYASEIEKNAIKVTQENFPNTTQIGDVMNFVSEIKNDKDINIVFIGFGKMNYQLFRMCTTQFQFAKKYNDGLKGVSWLFYPCNAILQWIKENNNPDVRFMVENVDSNNKTDLEEITKSLGVEPVMINSNLFSAQDRKRNYWTNIPITPLPKLSTLVLKDIMDETVDEKFYYNKPFTYHGDDKKICATLHINGHDILKRVNNKKFKSPTLTSCRGGNLQKKVFDNGRCRKLTPNEYRKLQTIPDWYKMNVSNSQIYNICGDGWTVDVIRHIFKGLKDL